MLPILENLLSALKANNTFDPAVMAQLFKNICQVAKSETGRHFDYSNNKEAQQVLSEILSLLNQHISNTPTTLFKMAEYNKTVFYSTLELELIIALAALKCPMDFPTQGDHNTLANFVETLCDRATAFLKQKKLLSRETYTYVLNALAYLDLNLTPELAQKSQALKNELFEGAFNNWNKSDWRVDQSIYLLWCNAVHGLQNDGSYQSAFDWSQVKRILDRINLKVASNPSLLDEKTSRALFQIYAVEFEHRAEFPAKLLTAMERLKANYTFSAYSSTFEKKVRDNLFNGNKGVIKQLSDKYHYVPWESCFNFDNPTTSFGLETDIAFKYGETELAIQVDGDKYHKTASFAKSNKTDKRTLFRNFCFDRAGLDHVEITDLENNHPERLLEIFTNKLVHPIHSKFQQKRIEVLENEILDFTHRYNDLFSKLSYDFQECDPALLALEDLIEQQKMLQQSLPFAIAEASFFEETDLPSSFEQIKNGSNHLLNYMLEQKLQLLAKKTRIAQDANMLNATLNQLSGMLNQFVGSVNSTAIKEKRAALRSALAECEQTIAQSRNIPSFSNNHMTLNALYQNRSGLIEQIDACDHYFENPQPQKAIYDHIFLLKENAVGQMNAIERNMYQYDLSEIDNLRSSSLLLNSKFETQYRLAQMLRAQQNQMLTQNQIRPIQNSVLPRYAQQSQKRVNPTITSDHPYVVISNKFSN